MGVWVRKRERERRVRDTDTEGDLSLSLPTQQNLEGSYISNGYEVYMSVRTYPKLDGSFLIAPQNIWHASPGSDPSVPEK
jgi:hypothetical protein